MDKLQRNRYRDKTSLYTANKTIFLIIAGLIGVISQIYKIFHTTEFESSILWTLQVSAIILGFLYFYSIAQEDSTKRAKDELKEFIDNKRNLEKLLLSIFYSKMTTSRLRMTEKEFLLHIDEWHKKSEEKNKFKYLFFLKQNVQSFIDEIGIEYFSYLLLTKAENSNFIKVLNSTESNINFLILKFNR